MRQLIRENRTLPIVRGHAEDAVAGVPAGNRVLELRALYDYLTERVDYRRDPNGAEWLQAPWAVLSCQIDEGIRPQLDCDDLTDLILAMAESLGHETALWIVSQLPTREFNHVLGLDYIGDVAVRVDLVDAYRPAGAAPPAVTRELVVDVNGGGLHMAPWWIS